MHLQNEYMAYWSLKITYGIYSSAKRLLSTKIKKKLAVFLRSFDGALLVPHTIVLY